MKTHKNLTVRTAECVKCRPVRQHLVINPVRSMLSVNQVKHIWLTADAGQLEVLISTVTDVVFTRDCDVTTDSAHQTTSTQLTWTTCTPRDTTSAWLSSSSIHTQKKTRDPRRQTVEMYSSAVISCTHLYTYDLDLWPLTLKVFSAMATHMMNISAKFHWNPSTD